MTNPYEPAIRAVRRQIDAVQSKLERLSAVEAELVELAKLESQPTRAVIRKAVSASETSPNGRRSGEVEPPAGSTWRSFVLQILREASRPLATRDIMKRTEGMGHPVKRSTLYWALNEERKEGGAQKVGGKWVAVEPELTLDSDEGDEAIEE